MTLIKSAVKNVLHGTQAHLQFSQAHISSPLMGEKKVCRFDRL